MSETHAPSEDQSEPGLYEIRIKGHLDDRWSDWFGGLTIALEDNGDTLLTGPVVDQAALHGLLRIVRDLGMPLVSVSPLEQGSSTTLGTGQADRSDVNRRILMKGIVQNEYGSSDVLELKEIDKPVVKDDGVLVRVHAAALHAGDYFAMRGMPIAIRLAVGLLKPRKNYIPGLDVAGHVEAVGKNVTGFQPGDEVFGVCNGACAEYACAGEDRFVLKPANLTFEQAAAIPTSAVAALRGLCDAGKLQPGQKVLINGASGGVGTFAVQIAKSFGAEVTGVCSTRNADLVRSIGADHVIDYTKDDFTSSGQRYDLILDNVGNHSFADCRRALTPQGTLLPNTGYAGMGYVVKAFVLSALVRQQGRPFVAIPNHQDLVVLRELVESGKVTPVIDRTYPLSDTPEAFRYLEEGHARGKVVITLETNTGT